MIEVKVWETASGIEKFSVSGHAGYASHGRDVVCAAVSALVLNAINSCEKLLGIALDVDDKPNCLRVNVPTHPHHEDMNLLLRSMLFGIEQTAAEHPRFVRITRTELRSTKPSRSD